MKKHKIILLTILMFALFLRTLALNRVPPELFGDELDVGYQAYSLLKTGRDYYGQIMPTYIHSFSEWRAPLLMYTTIPFIAIFGLNEWGVRLPSVFFAVASILILYLLVKKISQDKNIALLSAFLLSITPWHLQYSRASFEASLLIFLILSGVYLFLLGLENNRYFILSSIFFGLTFYTYNTANVFIPIFLALLFLIYKKKVDFRKKAVLISVAIFGLLVMPILYQVIFGHAGDRFSAFSVFNDQEIINNINLTRLEGKNSFLEVITHNKPIYFGRKIFENYTNAFSSKFLFSYGDIIFRHSIHTGELFWITLPFIILGVFVLIKSINRKSHFFIGWLLIAPIPSSLTVDGAAHATRLILMLPPLIVIASYGLRFLFSMKMKLIIKKTSIILIALIISGEMFLYLHQYYVHYPKQSWRWWQIGYKQAISYIKDNEKDYKQIYFNNTYEPSLIRFLFWTKYSPVKFMGEFVSDKPKADVVNGFNGFSLENKYYFGEIKDKEAGVEKFVKKGMLYLVSQEDEVGGDWDWEKNPPPEIVVLKTIRNPYGEPIFYVVTGD